jgi:hypothetical protein
VRLASFLAVSVVALAQPSADRIVVVDRVGATASADLRGADTASARDRLVARNEAAVVDVCLNYVEAQFLYFRANYPGDGHLAFARKIRSATGKRDGLFWPPDVADDESPMGPRFAAAAITEEQPDGNTQPFFGYYFKILLAQGEEARGGVRDFRVDGRLLSGFALVAWPAEHGVTGFRSFIVNHLGEIWSRDLGVQTSRVAAAMTVFAPDRNWARVALGSAEKKGSDELFH